MNTQHDRLDDAIDRVAARMTRVEDNEAFAARILAALPDRSPWTLHWLMPRLAMIAIILTAGVVWGYRRPQSIAPVASPIASVPTVSRPTALVAAVRELGTNRTKPVEPLERLEPLERASVDHERSLPSIAAVAALDIDSLAPGSLPEDAPLTLAPLAIADLPLTAESISPR
jgi:hypothetical protein